MPRSTIANRSEKTFDKLLEIYNGDTAPVNATANGPAVAFDAYTAPDAAHAFYTPGYSGYVAATNFWSVTLSASTTSTGTFTAVHAAIPLNGAATCNRVAISGDTISAIVPGAKFLRLAISKVGSPGDLKIGSYLTPAGG
jgi:hypothetical protein